MQSTIAEKDNSNNELLEEMRRLNDNFSKLQSKLDSRDTSPSE